MPRRALDQCPRCGRTVLWARLPFGGLKAFERPDSPLYEQYKGRDVASRYAVTPAIGDHFPTVRDLDASRLPLQYSEALALPHVVVCQPSRTNRRRRRRHFVLSR